MSHAADNDHGMDARYSFTLTHKSAACVLAVWIPADPDRHQVGGDPTVYGAFGSGTAPLSHFLFRTSIDEPAHRGTWVILGRGKTITGRVSVIEHARGTAGDSAHHAVTQVRATCTFS